MPFADKYKNMSLLALYRSKYWINHIFIVVSTDHSQMSDVNDRLIARE